MSKPSNRLTTAYPYLTDEEAQKFWNKAKSLAWQRCTNRQAYWATVNSIAVGMAEKLNQQRMDADEVQWQKEMKQRQDGWQEH